MSERRFRHTPGGLSSVGLLVVYRRRIVGAGVVRRLSEGLERIADERGRQIVAKAVMPDHTNLFVRVGPTVGCAGAYRRHRMGAEPRVSTPSQPREGVVVALVFPCLGRIRVGVDGAP